MKQIKIISCLMMFFALCFFGVQVIRLSHENQAHKLDYSELNHFKYGLFSVDAWKDRLTGIISDEIDDLYLTKKNKATLQTHLEKQLGILIDKVSERIEETNKNSPIKQSLVETFLDIKDIKKGIPEYAQAIMAEMGSSKSENQIKEMLKQKIELYLKNTLDVQDNAPKFSIIAKLGAEDEKSANQKLEKILRRNHAAILEKATFIIVLAILLFVFEAFTRGPLVPFHYYVLIGTLLVMMIVGVMTPMIDMEAKISQFSFILFEHPIKFENQILYFQSKSILDVFWIMITHKDLQMKLVGILVVGFSVIFPVCKLISSLLFYYDYCEARKNRLISFFVLQSGKWSMADVLVVSIFMAYIGFNGIINSQLKNMAPENAGIDLISTNGTNLQPGFFLFVTYVILAMFLANFLKNRPYQCIDKA